MDHREALVAEECVAMTIKSGLFACPWWKFSVAFLDFFYFVCFCRTIGDWISRFSLVNSYEWQLTGCGYKRYEDFVVPYVRIFYGFSFFIWLGPSLPFLLAFVLEIQHS